MDYATQLSKKNFENKECQECGRLFLTQGSSDICKNCRFATWQQQTELKAPKKESKKLKLLIKEKAKIEDRQRDLKHFIESLESITGIKQIKKDILKILGKLEKRELNLSNRIKLEQD